MDLRLSALRASLESLARDLGEDPRSAGVDRAIDEVHRAGRTVRDLADYASAPTPMPVVCTLEEVIYCARLQLPREVRGRIVVARFHNRRRIFVDGPLLSRTVERLLANATEASGGEVLVSARCEDRCVQVSIINTGGAPDFDPTWAQAPFRSNKPQHLGLGLALAKRDVEALGGTLVFARTPRGETVVTVQVPDPGVRRPNAEF